MLDGGQEHTIRISAVDLPKLDSILLAKRGDLKLHQDPWDDNLYSDHTDSFATYYSCDTDGDGAEDEFCPSGGWSDDFYNTTLSADFAPDTDDAEHYELGTRVSGGDPNAGWLVKATDGYLVGGNEGETILLNKDFDGDAGEKMNAYLAEADVQIMTSSDVSAGLVFNYKGYNQHYSFGVNAYHHKAYLFNGASMDNGDEVAGYEFDSGMLEIGVWYHLKVQVRGRHVTGYVNDIKVVDHVFSGSTDPVDGQPGLFSDGTTLATSSRFDNFTVTPLYGRSLVDEVLAWDKVPPQKLTDADIDIDPAPSSLKTRLDTFSFTVQEPDSRSSEYTAFAATYDIEGQQREPRGQPGVRGLGRYQ